MTSPSIRPYHIIALVALTVFAYAVHAWADSADKLLRVTVLDIGQGDAILIQSPAGPQMLVDGGPDGSVLAKLGAYLPSWDRTLDVVAVSHEHADHIAGLIPVFERYDVANVVQGSELYDSATARAWMSAVGAEGAAQIDAVAGTRIDLGASVSVEVLHPFVSSAGSVTKSPHDVMVVMLLKYGEFEMLLTGDAEADVERQLILRGVPVDADVLKVGHHGSKTSSIPEFLSAVSPDAAIISLGEKNRHGHPHQVTLDHLAEFGIPLYRTDRNGDVTVTSDGRSFSITTQYGR